MEPKPENQEPTYQLNPNQELFCLEYIKDRNQTKAYIRAGYSEDGARQNAGRLMTNDYIKARINELLLEEFSRVKLEIKYITDGLLKNTAANIADAYDPGTNTLKNIHDMPELIQKAILEITTEELWDGQGKDRKLIGYTKKIKLMDAHRAYELLGRYLKMFVDIHEVPGLSELAARYKAAEERMKEAPPGGQP